MTPPLDPIMEAAEGGDSPRPRRLSMIAGRRKASGDDAPASTSRSRSSSSSSSSSGSRSSGSRSRAAEGDAEEKPARPSRSRAAAKDDESEDDRPRVRRGRRGGRGRRTDGDGEAAAGEAEQEQPEAAAEAPEREPEPEPPAKATTAAPARTRTRTPRRAEDGDDGGGADAVSSDEIRALRDTVSRQEKLLLELGRGIDGLGERITFSGYRPRIAVFVDVPNLIYGYEGDGHLHMGRLLAMMTDGRDLVRATAYSPVSDDPREPMEQQRFVAPFVPFEFRIVTKPLKRFADGSIKGNFDVEMAIDMLLMADRVDVMAIVSGDADFARAVEAVQQKGVRVEVVAFAGSTSVEMRALSDRYVELGKVVDKIL
ncbi:MAG: NYN domain-containing protein [Dehalococcoidia bacterium]